MSWWLYFGYCKHSALFIYQSIHIMRQQLRFITFDDCDIAFWDICDENQKTCDGKVIYYVRIKFCFIISNIFFYKSRVLLKLRNQIFSEKSWNQKDKANVHNAGKHCMLDLCHEWLSWSRNYFNRTYKIQPHSNL